MTTIQQAIINGRNTLNDIVDNPQSEALLLLQHASNYSKEFLIAHSEECLSSDICQCYQSHLTRRASGEPLAYITREKEFWSLSLNIEPGVLIPRPETELLVEAALDVATKNQAINILDLGTGSGCIALALAKELPVAKVIACDNSEQSITLAKANAHKHALSNIEFILSDWFEHIYQNDFDIIVSNPPYISVNDTDIELNVKAFEPRSALFSGNQGFEDTYHIIQKALEYLNPGGTLLLEHGYQQAGEIRAYLKKLQYTNIQTLTDIQQLDRVTKGEIN